jgi:DNA-binding response OmpR family regulator
MRPKRRILLAGSDENRVSVLKCVLETNGFRVTTALTAAEALGHLRAETYDLLLCEWPLAGMQPLLDAARDTHQPTPTLVLASRLKECPEGLFGDDVILSDGFCVAGLRDRIKVLSTRKRGPRPMKKEPVSVPVIEVLAMVVNL